MQKRYIALITLPRLLAACMASSVQQSRPGSPAREQLEMDDVVVVVVVASGTADLYFVCRSLEY